MIKFGSFNASKQSESNLIHLSMGIFDRSLFYFRRLSLLSIQLFFLFEIRALNIKRVMTETQKQIRLYSESEVSKFKQLLIVIYSHFHNILFQFKVLTKLKQNEDHFCIRFYPPCSWYAF